jgi:RNA polymerase sigma-70 factor (ECF subfamily)
MTTDFSKYEVDPAIIRRVAEGSDPACEALFRQFETPVYNVAFRICQSADDAMDVLQDTFVQAFTRIDQYRHDAPFWAWLRKITVNLCLSRMRSLRRREWVSLEQLGEPGSAERPDEQMDLSQAFSQLPAEARTVVWLYDVEGFSHNEIAEAFGKSVSFSKTQLSRAREKLRAMLQPGDEDSTCTSMIPANS